MDIMQKILDTTGTCTPTHTDKQALEELQKPTKVELIVNTVSINNKE
jgi:hypothetical protein